MIQYKLAPIFLFLTVTATAQSGSCSSEVEKLLGTSGQIEDWWDECNGGSSSSTCLSESEVSKFKTLCQNEFNRDDCRQVVDYYVGKSRLPEAKILLMAGFDKQKEYFSTAKSYTTEVEKIWQPTKLNEAQSFAMGLLPSCNPKNKMSLLFSEKLRPQVAALKEEMQRVYEKLSNFPCPENGFALVAIGKVLDSASGFEIFTIDANKNFKTIRSTLAEGPFLPEVYKELVGL